MTAFLLRRLTASAVLIWLVLTLTFVIAELAPGGPGGLILDSRVPPEHSQRLLDLYGLDLPLAQRYGSWLRAIVVSGDWGMSFSAKRPVRELIGLYAPYTLALGAAALAVQFVLGLWLGTAAARRPGSRRDHAIRIVSLVLYSTPAFWLGLMAILLLSHTIPLFPPGSAGSLSGDASWVARSADLLRHLALPALVLGLATLGAVTRLVRGKLIETLQQDYVRTARAKGVGERTVVWVHALRNAAAPVVQLAGLSLPILASGTLVIEQVFSWPGIGRLTWEAIANHDYPVLLACTGWAALMVIIGTLVADLLLAVVDPRTRDEGSPA